MKLAVSIVGHWRRNHGGRFLEFVPGGGLQLLDVEHDRVERVSEILGIIACQHLTPHPARINVALKSADRSPDDSRMLPSPALSEDGSISDGSQLPSIPEDIFDRPMPPPHSPEKHASSPRSFLSMKPLQENADCSEKFEVPALKDINPQDEAPPKPKSKGVHLRELDGNKALPPRKRFRTHSSSPPSCKVTISKKSNDNYSTGDVLFAGPAARDHKGNLLLSHWIRRFCKPPQSPRYLAQQLFFLWSELDARFREPKTSDLDGSTVWIELGPKLVIERLSLLIQATMNQAIEQKKKKNNNKLDVLSTACKLKVYRVAVLDLDLAARNMCHGQNWIMVRSPEPVVLSVDDVILGTSTHAGNLKFLHHLDVYLPRFERCTSLGGSLDLIRKIITAWRKRTKGSGRFVAPSQVETVFSFADDELTVTLGIVRLLKAMRYPVTTPFSSPNVYLGEFWTSQRATKLNIVYHNQCMEHIQAFSAASAEEDKTCRATSEESVAMQVVNATIACDSKAQFKIFDGKSKVWKKLTTEEAVKSTSIVLLLKTCFGDDHSSSFDILGPKTKPVLGSMPDDQDVAERGTEKQPNPFGIKLTTDDASHGRSGAQCPIPTPLVLSPMKSMDLVKSFDPPTKSFIRSADNSLPSRVGMTSPTAVSPTKSFVTMIHPATNPTQCMQPIARRPLPRHPGMFHYNGPPALVPSGPVPVGPKMTPVFHPSMPLRQTMRPTMHPGLFRGVFPGTPHPGMHRGAPTTLKGQQEGNRTLVWVPMSVPCKPRNAGAL